MARTVRVAAAQLAPVFLDRDATVDKTCAAIAEAAANDAQLVVFPETFIPGYPYWAMVLDPLSINEFNRRLFDEAVEIPGPATDALCAAAEQAECYAVIGLNERDGGTLYNAQLFVGPDGSLLGKRRKLVPTSFERMVWGRGDGRDLEVFETPIGKLGALICFEHSNALFRYALQAQGEQIHVANWPGGMPGLNNKIDAAIRHYAFEAQAFVVNATAVVTTEIISALGEGGSVDSLRPGGGYSAVVAAGGDYLADPVLEGEGLVYADLDLGQIADRKLIVDSAGHYARPDVVHLVLNRRPHGVLEVE
ncbi:MAG: carbon-nitrogen hydrolase family protein [Candidatus Binatia bacterium]